VAFGESGNCESGPANQKIFWNRYFPGLGYLGKRLAWRSPSGEISGGPSGFK
jgi:hypothetical protein